MKSKQFDLTEGKILHKLLIIALPMMAGQVFQMLYNLIDMFFLGRISSDAVAASGSAGMFLWLSFAFILLGSIGAGIGVSQSLGKKDEELARKYSQNAMLVAIVIGLLYSTVMIVFSRQMIGFLQIQEEHVVADAMAYLQIVALSLPMSFVNFVFNATFNGSGNSKFPFYVKATGLIINIILSPILIFILGMGVTGAALATVVAQSTVTIIFLYAMKRYKHRPFAEYRYRDIFKVDQKVVKQIFKWSLPVSLESLCFTILTMIIARFIASFGAGAIAANRVGTQIESLSWLVGGGFAMALTSYVGQNFGAKRWDRIHKGFRMSALIMSTYGLLITLLLFFGANFLFRLFISEPEIVSLGIAHLRIFSLVQLVGCLEAIAVGAFRGVGKTKPPSIVSVIFNFLRVIAAYYLSQTALGLNGIWVGMALGNLFRGLVLLAWYLLFARKQPGEEVALETAEAV